MRRHDWKNDPARLCEVRTHVPYDEQSPGHVIHWNGSMVGSLDRQFLGGAARLVVEHYERERVGQ